MTNNNKVIVNLLNRTKIITAVCSEKLYVINVQKKSLTAFVI